jgi:hypothetical protein
MKLLAKWFRVKSTFTNCIKTSLLLLNNISSKEIADRYSKTKVIQPCYTILVKTVNFKNS